MREKVFTAIVLAVTVMLWAVMPKISAKMRPVSPFTQSFAEGLVQRVLEEDLTPDPVVTGRFRGKQKLLVKILDGAQKGKEFEVYNTLSSLHNTRAYAGLKAVFTVREQNGVLSIWLYNQKRDTHLYLLTAVFIGALLLLGKKQGVQSVLGLIFTCTIIVTVLIPALFAGYPPVAASLLLIPLTALVSFILIGGFSRKTYSAILGTICGISIAGIFSAVTAHTAQLSGINMEAGEQLLNIAPDYNLKVGGLLFTSILIASLGAVMDISMSIASAIQEILNANPKTERKKLFASGLNIGRDVTGTMSNTLILAFAGSSLPMIMMIWGYGMSLRQFMNIPRIGIEIMQGLSASIGLIAAVPCTAAVSVFMLKTHGKTA